MGESPHSERRQFPRIQKTWFLHYVTSPTPGASRGVGSVQDLSAAGVRFSTEDSLDLNASLWLKFNTPLLPMELVRGKIVWRQEVRKNQFEYGVVFEGLTPEAMAGIDQFVRKKLQG